MARDFKYIKLCLAVLVLAIIFRSPNPYAYEFKPKPGQKCVGATTFGARPYTLGLDKIIVVVKLTNNSSEDHIPVFFQDANFTHYTLNLVREIFGPCIGDRSKIVLGDGHYATEREKPNTLSIEVNGYVADSKDVLTKNKTHYAVLWLRFYRPDGPYKQDGFFMPHVPGVIFLDAPEKSIEKNVTGMLGTFLYY